MTVFPITTHLISNAMTGPGYENPEDPRRVSPTKVYETMCGRYLPGQGHPFRCSFTFYETDCEHCLEAVVLKTLAEVP